MTIQNLIPRAHSVLLNQEQMAEAQKGNYPYVITGKSRFMSGWGYAADKAAWDVVLCKDRETADRIMNGLYRDGDRYIDWHYSNDIPYKSTGRIYSVRCAEDCHAWLK